MAARVGSRGGSGAEATVATRPRQPGGEGTRTRGRRGARRERAGARRHTEVSAWRRRGAPARHPAEKGGSRAWQTLREATRGGGGLALPCGIWIRAGLHSEDFTASGAMHTERVFVVLVGGL